jgi:hypothetical protein
VLGAVTIDSPTLQFVGNPLKQSLPWKCSVCKLQPQNLDIGFPPPFLAGRAPVNVEALAGGGFSPEYAFMGEKRLFLNIILIEDERLLVRLLSAAGGQAIYMVT